MSFQLPAALVGLVLLPVLAALYLFVLSRPPGRAVVMPDLAIVARAASVPGRRRRWAPPALYLLALTAIILGLARPVASLPQPSPDGVVVLSVDVSRSMLAADMSPNRMEAAKAAAKAFVEALPRGFRVGLVTFSSYATTVVSPTKDHAEVVDAVGRLATEFATAIGDGLLEAVWALPGRERPPYPAQMGEPLLPGIPQAPGPARQEGTDGRLPPGVVVLLSDGQSNRGTLPLEAARIAREQNATVHTVGIGTPEGTSLTVGGRTIWVRLDEETLRGVAEIAGGTYYRATNAGELRDVYRQLGRRIGWERRPTEVTAIAAGTALVALVAAVALSSLSVHRLL